MHKRTNRLVVAVGLVAAAIIGGFFVFSASEQAETVLVSSGDVAARLERMIAATGEIASAQQAYVVPGQLTQPWAERSATSLRQFGDDLTAVRSQLRSSDGTRVAGSLSEGLQALVSINERARQDLQESQDILAADLIFNEGRDTVASMIGSLRGLIAAERAAAATERTALIRQQWGLLAIVGLTWLGGLLILVPLPAGREPAESTALTIDLLTPSVSAREPAEPTPAIPSVDLSAAAEVCTSLAQVVDAAMLPPVFARAASVLDARGMILWVGAGEELFPALAHGYDKAVIGRLRPLPRSAENATAEAWRTGEMRTVASNVVSHGALAAPLFSVGGCVGVLAAEVRNGREHDRATLAVAMMFAAQLAGIVPAWPAASAVDGSMPSSRHA